HPKTPDALRTTHEAAVATGSHESATGAGVPTAQLRLDQLHFRRRRLRRLHLCNWGQDRAEASPLSSLRHFRDRLLWTLLVLELEVQPLAVLGLRVLVRGVPELEVLAQVALALGVLELEVLALEVLVLGVLELEVLAQVALALGVLELEVLALEVLVLGVLELEVLALVVLVLGILEQEVLEL
ncbi:unnamed protein product, partial [Closterium sp. NIES-53]